MRSKAEAVRRSHQSFLLALPLIPVYLGPGRPPHDSVDEACLKLLFNGRSKVLVESHGAFAGLPADMWNIIFEKLCPASTSLITGPSVIARDISNAQLVCRKFYSSGLVAWKALQKLVQAEAGNFPKSEAGTNRQAARELQELEMQRHAWTTWPRAHQNLFSDDHISILQQAVSWEDILSKPQLYNEEGLRTAALCRAMQPFQKKSAALQLYLTLRDAAQHVFGLRHPCAVPAVILLAVKHEKASAATDICSCMNNVKDVKSAIRVVSMKNKPLAGFQNVMVKSLEFGMVPSAFHFRRLMHSRARSIEGLLKLADDLRGNIPVRDRKRLDGKCDCGMSAALCCEFESCRLCCPGPCRHHKKGQVCIAQPSVCTQSTASSNFASSSSVYALNRKREASDTPSTATSTQRRRVVP